MNVRELVADLAERGVTLSAHEGRIAYEAPRGVLTPVIKAQLIEHRSEVLSALQSPRVGDGLGGIEPAEPSSVTVAELCAMRLSEFAQASLMVEVRSEVLGEVVIFASDSAVIDPGERRVVYRASELRALLDLSPEHLHQIHLAKKTFRARVGKWQPN